MTRLPVRPLESWPLVLGLFFVAACNSSSSDTLNPGAGGGGTGTGVALTNLGLAAGAGISGSGPFVLNVPEDPGASEDLNGDGDFLDLVMHIVDPANGQLQNTGLAAFQPPAGYALPAPEAQFADDFVVLPVHESAQGDQDLNGDGDSDDLILHLFDRATGNAEAIEYAVFNAGTRGLALADGKVAFLVLEADQGNADLTGDGDTSDYVLHVLDVASGMVQVLDGEANWVILAEGSSIAYSRVETAQSGDLNGDGDEADPAVLQVLDAQSGLVTNAELAIRSLAGFAGGAWVTSVSESEQGVDLNGDTDTGDEIFVSYDPVLAETRNHGVGGLPALPAVSKLQGDTVVALISEVAMDEDLNGDGDALDRVAFALDPSTGGAQNTGLASHELVLLDDGVGILVDEEAQGGQDIDGNGFMFGTVPHIFDPVQGTTLNLGLNGFGLRPAGRYLYFNRFEIRAQMDINGDGDMDDTIPHWWDSTTGMIHHTERSSLTPPLDIRDGTVLIAVDEGDESEDLNGDGDTQDVFFFAIEMGTGRVVNIGLPTGEGRLATARRALLQVPESLSGNDMNGDGDIADTALIQADFFN